MQPKVTDSLLSPRVTLRFVKKWVFNIQLRQKTQEDFSHEEYVFN